jgi:hypothetical protein
MFVLCAGALALLGWAEAVASPTPPPESGKAVTPAKTAKKTAGRTHKAHRYLPVEDFGGY